jgi:hypothetical protein
MTTRLGMGSTRRQVLAATALLFAVGYWQAAPAVTKASTGQAVRAGTASTSRPYCLKGQHLKGSEKRGYKCWFRKHGEWWWEGVECQTRYQRKSIYRHGHETGERCVPTPHVTASTAPSLYGSITNVHVISGNTLQATYTTTSSGCTHGGSCFAFAHAFQVPASQACEYGDGHQWWTFSGAVHRVPYTETSTATFTKVLSGPIKLCLFVEAAWGPIGTVTLTQFLVAESTEAGSLTPLTVNNICSFNPGLGVRFWSSKVPALTWWDNNRDGVPDFGAINYQGDSGVDLAFVMQGKVLTWMGFCNPHETPWINLPQFNLEQQQRQVSQPPKPPSLTPSVEAKEWFNNIRDTTLSGGNSVPLLTTGHSVGEPVNSTIVSAHTGGEEANAISVPTDF